MLFSVLLCTFQLFTAKMMFVLSSFVAIYVFLKSFIIASTHRRRYVASGTGFKQDSPNRMQFFTESTFGFTRIRIRIRLIEYPLNHSRYYHCLINTKSRAIRTIGTRLEPRELFKLEPVNAWNVVTSVLSVEWCN